MSIVTRRTSMTSVVRQVLFSSFSTLGSAVAASPSNLVRVYVSNTSNGRFWLGGNSSVSSANGYLITTGGTTFFEISRPEELWAITSAAANTTCSFLFTNQPV